MSTNSEDALGKKFDHCLADSLIKLGVGIGVGSVFSLVFFKRKLWPITMGFGTGLGMGIANCQNDIQDFRKLFSRTKTTLFPSPSTLQDVKSTESAKLPIPSKTHSSLTR